MLLEVIVQTLADAKAAAAGGADRLEVVREIDRGGLTPALDLVRAIQAEVPLPLRVMVRENDGFGVSDARELDALQRTFAELAALRVHGAVMGFAADGAIDLDTTRSVMAAAPDLPVTFHRAFDSVRDSCAAIDAVAGLPQVDRILTGGGDDDWTMRIERLHGCVNRASGRLTIVAGGGVDRTGLRLLAAGGIVSEAHVGRIAREPAVATAPVSARCVRRLKALMLGASCQGSGARS
jgi:copper homeostasis protein